jgi:hypothetical protein
VHGFDVIRKLGMAGIESLYDYHEPERDMSFDKYLAPPDWIDFFFQRYPCVLLQNFSRYDNEV